jgi:phosphonate transport system permease protein
MTASRQPRATTWATLGLGIGVTASISVLPWDLSAIDSPAALARSWARFAEFLSAFGTPDLSADTLTTAARLMLDTLSTALLGVTLGLLLAYPLALGACRAIAIGEDPPRWPWHPFRRLALEACRLSLDVLRGVPDFAWALVLANFTGIGTPTGVLAIAISVAGMLGKILSEQWDHQDPGLYASLRSTGAGPLQTFLYGLQPMASRSMLSFLLMRAECAIRNSSVIGVIAGGGLGAGLWDAFKDSRYDEVVTLLLAMLVLTAGADVIANFLRYQLRVDPNHPRAAGNRSPAASTRRRALGVGICLALVVGSVAWQWPALQNLAADLDRLEADYAVDFASRLLWSPDLTAAGVAAHESVVPLAVALLTTVAGVLLASALSYPGSIAFQVHSDRFLGEYLSWPARCQRWFAVIATRGLGLLWRGIPEVAWVLILGAFCRQGLLAGVVAVALHSAGVLLRVFVETVDNVPYRRLEQVSGARRAQVFAYAALPAAWPDWKAYAFFQFEVNLRMGIVLGMVGAGGLGEAFDGNLRYFRLERASTFLWTMVLLTVLVDRLSRHLQLRRSRC